eukprot:4209373-Lingulodinium_polyedra.AAC.1
MSPTCARSPVRFVAWPGVLFCFALLGTVASAMAQAAFQWPGANQPRRSPMRDLRAPSSEFRVSAK